LAPKLTDGALSTILVISVREDISTASWKKEESFSINWGRSGLIRRDAVGKLSGDD